MSTSIESFRLPKDGAIYTRSIFDRCRNLIAYRIWDGLELHRLDSWINNFRNEKERYLAAKILDALIYRSDSQTISLMHQLFQRTIPDLQRNRKISPSLTNLYTSLKEKSDDPVVRIVPVLPPDSPPIKSGSLIGRYIHRYLGFSSKWIAQCSDVPSLISQGYVVIFVDDFLGTGNQFIEFIEKNHFQDSVGSGKCVYVPLVAHKDGIQKLEEYLKALSVSTVEMLDDSHAFFNEIAGYFPDDCNTIETARNFYYDMLERHGIHLHGSDRRGYGCFELVYAFKHAVPDNSLPILWWSESDWQPLFSR